MRLRGQIASVRYCTGTMSRCAQDSRTPQSWSLPNFTFTQHYALRQMGNLLVTTTRIIPFNLPSAVSCL
jgi:hypothetical protein